MADVTEPIGGGTPIDYRKVIRSALGKDNASIIVAVGGVAFSSYESGQVSPGANANGYNVKTAGGLFSTVTSSNDTTIKNLDGAETITVYLNTDGSNPITIEKGESLNIANFAVTNIFIDTTASQTGAVEITLFG